MRHRNWLIAGAVFAGMGAAALSVDAQERPLPPAPRGEPWRGERFPDRWLDEVRNAPDPSSAVEAYSRARERLTHDAAAEHEYMHKMIEFGLPELTEKQARSVAERRPRDGTPRAVMAYMAARRGNDAEAFAEIVIADRLEHHDDFIERTAGQLVAWLDTRAVKRSIPRQTLADVERMRERLNHHPVFRDAYWRARRVYEDQRSERRFGFEKAGGDKLAVIPREAWTTQSADPFVCVGATCEPWRPAAAYASVPIPVDGSHHGDRDGWRRVLDGLRFN